MSILTNSSVLRPGQLVGVPALPSPGNWPAHGCAAHHHIAPGRVVGGMTIIEDGLRLTLYQVRTLRERTLRLPADAAGWYPPQEIAG